MQADGFHIGKTYRVSELHSLGIAQTVGVKGCNRCNHVFSSMVTAANLTSSIQLVPVEDALTEYRTEHWTMP